MDQDPVRHRSWQAFQFEDIDAGPAVKHAR